MRYNKRLIICGIVLVSVIVLSFKSNESSFRGLPFSFDFDQIDYYYNGSDELEGINIINKEGIPSGSKGVLSAQDSLILREKQKHENTLQLIATWEYPLKTIDTLVVEDFETYGYKRYDIKEELNDSVYQFLHDPLNSPKSLSLCLPVYRDILVFREKGAIVGIAKICFTCEQNYFFRPVKDPPDFYDGAVNYGGLRMLLHNQIR